MSLRKTQKKIPFFFQFFFIFDTPRILQNVRQCAIGKLNAGMMMNAVAIDIVVICSIHAIQHFSQCFQATGCHVVDVCMSRRLANSYVRNSHLCNRCQTATATAANTHGTHNNCVSAQGLLSAHRPYVGCVFEQLHHVNCDNWAHTN